MQDIEKLFIHPFTCAHQPYLERHKPVCTSSVLPLFTASSKSERGGKENQIEDAIFHLFYSTSSAGHSAKVGASSMVGAFISPLGFSKS